MNRLEEVSCKLELMRQALQATKAAGVRLRGTDWFAWATAGGANTVLLAAETGVAEVLVTAADAWILTDAIEAQRLKDEQLPNTAKDSPYKVSVHPWAKSSEREAFVREATSGGTILSDRPSGLSDDRPASNEFLLPQSLVEQRRVLLPSEIERYRQVGQLASEAMTEVLTQAQPTWTEYQLAGAGAAALWARGLHPALTLAAGDRRLPLYRHPVPSGEAIGRSAMLVFCARGFGLYANLSRFVYFDRLSDREAALHEQIRDIEAAALLQCRVQTPLNQVYHTLQQAYEQRGYVNAIREHHQGGTTGYQAREIVATAATTEPLLATMAIAWNPSLPGVKIEDTFLLHENNQLENLTFDPQWQRVEVNGYERALPLEMI